MAIVTVKNKYQVVIPQRLREKVGVSVGDLLEAKVERGKLTFTRTSPVDRGIAEGLEDIRKGRVFGPYGSVGEAMRAFRQRTTRMPKHPKRTSS